MRHFEMTIHFYFAPAAVRSIAIFVSVCLAVCLSVCSLARLKNSAFKLHKSFYTCYLWPRLSFARTTTQYVMYFRYCG